MNLFWQLCFTIFLLLTPSAWAAYPSAQGFITDLTQSINDGDRAKIESWINFLDQKTGAQIAVLTVKSTEPETIEQYAVGVFKQWGIGNKDKDNGVLLVVALDDRTLRIEVGYGLEGAITDALARRIIEQIIVPAFKEGRTSEGIENGVQAIVSLVAKEYNIQIPDAIDVLDNKNQSQDTDLMFAFAFVLIIIFLIMRPFIRNDGWGPGSGGGFGGGGFGGGGYSGGGGGG